MAASMFETNLFPVVSSVVAAISAIRLHRHCVRRQDEFNKTNFEHLGLLFFNKLALGTLFISILFFVGEFNWLWLGRVFSYPPIDEAMWDCVETIALLFLAMMCYHAPDVVDQKVDYSEILRKNNILRGIITALDAFTWMKDSDGKFVFCDHEFSKLFYGIDGPSSDIVGFTSDELIHLYNDRFGGHTFLPMVNATDEISLANGFRSHFVETGKIGGKFYVFDIVKTPVYNKDGTLRALVCFAFTCAENDSADALSRVRRWVSNGSAKKVCDGVYWITNPKTRCIWHRAESME